MADDVSAGRLHLDAYADTSGFKRDAQAKIDAAVKDVRAKIKAELDTRGLITEAKAAAKKAQQAAVVRLKTSLDARTLATEAKAAAAKASTAARVKIGADLDQAKFQADLAAAVAAMNNKYSVSVNVDVDTTAANAQLAAFKAAQRNLPISLGVNVNMGNLGSVISQFSKFPMLAGGVFLLGAAIAQVGGGLIAMTSAASQAVMTLAALPNLIGSIGQGIAVLFAGFSGIGDAVTELGQADTASAAQTATAAGVREDSARRVADAQEALKDAYHQAADAARFAGYAVQDAEWALARAQESAADAQERLNEAREAARDRLDDLNDSLERAALTEETAANNLQKAKQALQDILWDNSASAQERRDAELAVKQAQQDLKDARDQHNELSKETAEANEAGVKGSEELEAARDAVRDANHAVMLAERQLAEARHAAADTAAQNAEMIADAQQAIIDAQQSGAQAMGAQTAAIADQTSAFDKLTPAAQRFALFLFNTVMPRFGQLRDRIQEAILPPIQTGITKAMPFIDTLETGLLGTADVVGDLAIDLGELFSSRTFRGDVAKTMNSNNRALEDFGAAGRNLISILARVARVAGPTLLEPFAKWTRELTRGWRATLLTTEGTEGMRQRFVRAREMAVLLGDIIGNISGALYGMGKAAVPAGTDLLNTFERVTQGWSDWANSEVGQDKMREFFNNTKPATEEIGRLVANLSELIVSMGEAGGGPLVGFLKGLNGIVVAINAILDVPVLGKVVGWLLTIAGMAGAFGMVAGMMTKMAGGIALLARISGITKLFNLFRMSLLATRLGLIALAVQQKAVMIGQKLMAGVMLVTTAVMKGMRLMAVTMFGPWGIALVAVIAAFVLLYKKVDWFRAAVDWVMGKVVDAFNWVKDAAFGLWDELFGHSVFPDIVDGLVWFWGIVEKIFGFVVDAIEVLAKVFTWLWKNAVQPAWTAIQKAISIVWNYYYKPILTLLWKALRVAGEVALWLWKNAIVPAWKGIQAAIRVAWPIIKRIFALFRAGIERLAEVAKWLWKKVITPAWRGIQKAISIAWNKIIKPVMRAMSKAIDVLGGVVRWLWKNVVQPVWKSIQKAISFAWNNVVKPVFRALGKGVDVLGATFKWLWNKVVQPVWNGIKKTINTVWTFIRDKVFDPLIDLVKNDIPNAFEKAKNGIKTIWDKLKGIAAAPVKFVVDTVYTKGIKAVVDKIPGVSDLPGVSFNYAKGTSSVLPGYTPGRDPHNFVSADGRMALNLSGGEGIARPEVVRQVGSRAWDAMNAAAAKGGDALSALLSGGHAPHGRPKGFSEGGVLNGVRRTLSFFLGGTMPLAGATDIKQHSGYPWAQWAGDLNSPYDLASPPAAIQAWKPGTVAQVTHLTDSYGSHVRVNHAGQTTLYAHLSSIIARVGQSVGAGTMLGRVGETGNADGAHLHFEVAGGSVDPGDMSGGGGGPSPAEKKGEKKADGWKDFIGAAKEIVLGIPSKLSQLVNMDGWGPMMRESLGNVGGQFIQWVNDKIPDEIEIPKFPDIPLPDNPIPNKFDQGGDWRSGTAGVNLSGKTETVFTNQNIVDLTGDLARIASGLRAQTVDSAGGTAGAPLVGSLTLQTTPDKTQQALGDMQHALRILSLGGVHAKRLAGAPV